MRLKPASTGLGVPALAGIALSVLFLTLTAAAADKDPKDPPEKKDKEEKAAGPDHNVTLMEEQGVVDLLKKAKKAREKAETDATVWPECVKYYAEILNKYPNTVYLDRWEGPDKTEMWFKNGLYKSTRERVAKDIATLPPAGLQIYREINDRVADPMYADAVARFDERKMEQVAQDFSSASKGIPAMEWLAEVSYDSGGQRQALARLNTVLKSETVAAHKTSLLARRVLSLIQLGDATAAGAALTELKAASENPANGALRIGTAEGAAALEKISQRVAGMAAANPTPAAHDGNRSWDTYFGNAEHNRLIPARSSIGILRWSESILKLLYGPDYDPGHPDPNNPQAVDVPTLNYQLVAHEGYFYLADSKVVIAYPIGKPKPGLPSKGGNAKFAWPSDPDTGSGTPANRNNRIRFINNGQGQYVPARQHPYYCTIANDRLYMVYGADAAVRDPNQWVGPGNEIKQPSNYLVALGRQRAGGTLESGKLVWSLATDSPTFQSQSKADQEWLKSIFFVHSPTYESGVLYCYAAHSAGATEAWVAAFDADNGKLLWRTQICAAQGYISSGAVQPDLGMPVTVANGTVYVCTNLGAVGALDAVSGTIKWIRVYDRVKTQPDRWGQGGQTMSNDFWGPNPPIVFNNILVVTPQDSDKLYAYYTETGKDGEKEIEAGQRKYEISRTGGSNEDSSTGGLKHLLGIIHGNMVLSGTGVHFYDIKSGKKSGPFEAFTFDSPIHGRGVVTEDQVFVPTEKALVRIDCPVVNGKFSPKVREDSYKWQDGKVEAGNIFVAGDVLYTVSHTHVNAYLVWEDMEKKLNERLAKTPTDLAAFGELVDVYLRVEHFDQALAQVDKAEQAAEQVKSDPKTPALLAKLRGQKFDALFALGDKTQKTDDANANENKQAYEYYKKALQASLLPEVTPEYPVMALKAMAENASLRGDLSTAVQHYQEMMAKHGDVVYSFEKGGSKRARLFAQSRIDELKKKNPASYEKIEAEAEEAVKKAGDATALQAVISTYPNSNASGHALLKLAQTTLPTDADRSRQYVREFLNRYPTSPDASIGLALLEASFEHSFMLAPAKDVLYRINGRTDDPALTFNPLYPKTPLQTTVKQWAETRLKEPQFQGSPSTSIYKMGHARLKEGWAAKNTGSIPVMTVGLAPQAMRRNLIYIENQNELLVLSGREKGEELWTPHPKLPAGCHPQGLWADRLLVMYGEHEMIAYDSKEMGNVVWKYSYKGGLTPTTAPLSSPDGQKIIVGYPGGTISVVDASTGNELWYTQTEGAQIFGQPAAGDNCLAVAGMTPAKVVIYDMDTGAKRAVIDVSSGSLTAGPIIHDDRMYLAEKNNQVRAFDTNTGKLLWEQACEADIRALTATRELLFGQLSDKTVIAIKTATDANHSPWNPLLDTGAKVTGFHPDGDDLYVIVNEPAKQNAGRSAKVISYSIPKQGKLQWEADISNEWVGNILYSTIYFTAEHLVLAQANWDPTNQKSSAIVLVDRKTGKLTFDQALSSDANRNSGNLPFSVQVFDGGMVIADGKKRTAYISPDIDNLDDDLKSIDAKLTAKANDPDLTIRWAKLTYDKGEHEKALTALTALLKTELPDDKFAAAYEEFARLRRDDAIKTKATLKFNKLDKAPKLDGNLADWGKASEQKFDSWRDIYLSSEEGTGALAKKNMWKGGDDLSVTFRGGYDDKNLYLLFVVKDDTHKNEQTEARYCDFGDSITLMFDSNNDGGVAFRGEEFSLGAGLNKEGKLLAWRWVEHGKYLPGSTPLENGAFAARNEPEKTTVYQFTLPLESLAMKAEAGKSFGFSFAVHDQDGVEVDKSIGPSPGVLSPPEPRLFAKGVLEK